MCRVLCDTIVARLARFLYPRANLPASRTSRTTR
jgi:hypothetical protein